MFSEKYFPWKAFWMIVVVAIARLNELQLHLHWLWVAFTLQFNSMQCNAMQCKAKPMFQLSFWLYSFTTSTLLSFHFMILQFINMNNKYGNFTCKLIKFCNGTSGPYNPSPYNSKSCKNSFLNIIAWPPCDCVNRKSKFCHRCDWANI